MGVHDPNAVKNICIIICIKEKTIQKLHLILNPALALTVYRTNKPDISPRSNGRLVPGQWST